MKPIKIYTQGYTASYRNLYVEHPQWASKHSHNLKVLDDLMVNSHSWLDTCCGQAWHFAHMRNTSVSKTGIDISAAQLLVASSANTNATFIQADIGKFEFVDNQGFDVVTNFWGSYSYLDDEHAIARLMRKLIRWTNLGGSVYVELITPEALDAYGASAFADASGTYTSGRSADYIKWSFNDTGGTHMLTSPPLSFFLDIFLPCFQSVDSSKVVTTMRQLVARGKVRDP